MKRQYLSLDWWKKKISFKVFDTRVKLLHRLALVSFQIKLSVCRWNSGVSRHRCQLRIHPPMGYSFWTRLSQENQSKTVVSGWYLVSKWDVYLGQKYSAARQKIRLSSTHETSQYQKNQIENSHQRTCQQSRSMWWFKSADHTQKLLSVHGTINNLSRQNSSSLFS